MKTFSRDSRDLKRDDGIMPPLKKLADAESGNKVILFLRWSKMPKHGNLNSDQPKLCLKYLENLFRLKAVWGYFNHYPQSKSLAYRGLLKVNAHAPLIDSSGKAWPVIEKLVEFCSKNLVIWHHWSKEKPNPVERELLAPSSACPAGRAPQHVADHVCDIMKGLRNAGLCVLHLYYILKANLLAQVKEQAF